MGSMKRGSRGKGQRMDLNLTSLTCHWLAASVIARFNLTVTECCGDCFGDNSCRRSCRLCYFRGNLRLMPVMAPLSPVLFFYKGGEHWWVVLGRHSYTGSGVTVTQAAPLKYTWVHFLPLFILHSGSQELEPIPATTGRRRDTPWTSSQFIKGLICETNRQSRWFFFKAKCNLKSTIHLACMFWTVGGTQMKARVGTGTEPSCTTVLPTPKNMTWFIKQKER